tara:strand:+ start:180 stop:572 length:393 start_codon:yes stop_codon:yes gene_type:complete
MKKSIILGCLFLTTISFSAQEKEISNNNPTKDTKVVIKPEVFNQKEERFYKVTPVAEVNYETSKSRASKSASKGKEKGNNSNSSKIEPTLKPYINKPNSSRASKESVRASKGNVSSASKIEPSSKKQKNK